LLEIAKLDAGYGRKRILSGIDLGLNSGEIVVIVGPNGAGKTTLLSAISGICHVFGGSITFKGENIAGKRADAITRRGLAHSPEGRQIFQRLTVEENLVAAHVGRGPRTFEDLRGEVFELFPILKERRNGSALRLSGGQQQMLAIGRAIMAEPELLLLDEPSLGLAPKLITQIFRIVLEMASTGMSILLVEQNVRLALEVADHIYVLEGGSMRLDGSAQEVADNPELAHLYLGAAAGEHTLAI
jgi:branched-chain amino acid transport system ATP-binding protein